MRNTILVKWMSCIYWVEGYCRKTFFLKSFFSFCSLEHKPLTVDRWPVDGDGRGSRFGDLEWRSRIWGTRCWIHPRCSRHCLLQLVKWSLVKCRLCCKLCLACFFNFSDTVLDYHLHCVGLSFTLCWTIIYIIYIVSTSLVVVSVPAGRRQGSD